MEGMGLRILMAAKPSQGQVSPRLELEGEEETKATAGRVSRSRYLRVPRGSREGRLSLLFFLALHFEAQRERGDGDKPGKGLPAGGGDGGRPSRARARPGPLLVSLILRISDSRIPGFLRNLEKEKP